MQCRRAIQQDWMLADYLSENIPDFGCFLLHHLLGGFNRGGNTAQDQLAKNERLEQLQRHLLGQTGLV